MSKMLTTASTQHVVRNASKNPMCKDLLIIICQADVTFDFFF